MNWQYPWRHNLRNMPGVAHLKRLGFDGTNKPSPAGKAKFSRILEILESHAEQVIVTCEDAKELDAQIIYVAAIWSLTFNTLPFQLDYLALRRVLGDAQAFDFDEDDDLILAANRGVLIIPKVNLFEGYQFRNFAAFLAALMERRRNIRDKLMPRIILTAACKKKALTGALTQNLGGHAAEFIDANFARVHISRAASNPGSFDV